MQLLMVDIAMVVLAADFGPLGEVVFLEQLSSWR